MQHKQPVRLCELGAAFSHSQQSSTWPRWKPPSRGSSLLYHQPNKSPCARPRNPHTNINTPNASSKISTHLSLRLHFATQHTHTLPTHRISTHTRQPTPPTMARLHLALCAFVALLGAFLMPCVCNLTAQNAFLRRGHSAKRCPKPDEGGSATHNARRIACLPRARALACQRCIPGDYQSTSTRACGRVTRAIARVVGVWL